MTHKLIKYEMRSMLRLFLPLWAAVLVIAGINHFTIRAEQWQNAPGSSALTGSMMFIYVIVIMALAVVALVVMVRRFYKGLLRDEGYLMFTLPVKTSQLIWSKCISATILTGLTGIVCFLSVLILVLDGGTVRLAAESLRSFEQQYGSAAGLITQIVVLAVVLMLAVAVASIMQAYLSMAIGQLANKHKVGFSILTYVGISIALSVLGSILMSFSVYAILMEKSFGPLLAAIFEGPITIAKLSRGVWIGFGALIAECVLQIVIFYIPTWLLLKNRLNLE